METIKNYLESMFATLPDTPEVRKAKDELWQMMEDKYTELLEEGETENTAIGTVIAEFGNLDELAEDLGLNEELNRNRENEEARPTRLVSLEEVKDYLKSIADNANRIALGVLCCIICPIGPILAVSGGNVSTIPIRIGVVVLCLILAVALASFIYAGMELSKWSYLRKERCMMDMATTAFVKDEKDRYRSNHMLKLILGILLCALCWIPSMVMAGGMVGRANLSIVSAAIVLILVGFGVFLLVQNSYIHKGYNVLLGLNPEHTISSHYSERDGRNYKTDKAKNLMELYWPTVTCLYLSISFLTFAWAATWIIWPIAGVVNGLLKRILTMQEGEPA